MVRQGRGTGAAGAGGGSAGARLGRGMEKGCRCGGPGERSMGSDDAALRRECW